MEFVHDAKVNDLPKIVSIQNSYSLIVRCRFEGDKIASIRLHDSFKLSLWCSHLLNWFWFLKIKKNQWVQVLQIAYCRNAGKDCVHKTQSGQTLPWTLCKQELFAPGCPLKKIQLPVLSNIGKLPIVFCTRFFIWGVSDEQNECFFHWVTTNLIYTVTWGKWHMCTWYFPNKHVPPASFIMWDIWERVMRICANILCVYQCSQNAGF
jgi:hypothetical protein